MTIKVVYFSVSFLNSSMHHEGELRMKGFYEMYVVVNRCHIAHAQPI